MAIDILVRAHTASKNNKLKVEDSSFCGCFHCKRIFSADEVRSFVYEGNGKATALCPHCKVDAVLPDSVAATVGFDFVTDFLREMHDRWF